MQERECDWPRHKTERLSSKHADPVAPVVGYAYLACGKVVIFALCYNWYSYASWGLNRFNLLLHPRIELDPGAPFCISASTFPVACRKGFDLGVQQPIPSLNHVQRRQHGQESWLYVGWGWHHGLNLVFSGAGKLRCHNGIHEVGGGWLCWNCDSWRLSVQRSEHFQAGGGGEAVGWIEYPGHLPCIHQAAIRA